jgi:methyl-accepting chemotaxis protein
MEPLSDVSAGKQVLITTLSVPVRVGDKVVGASGIDISLDLLQSAAEQSQHDLFEGAGRMLIVSSSGVMAADSRDATKITQPLSVELGASAQAVQQAIQKAIAQFDKHGETIRATYPVAPLQGLAPWGVIIDLPESVLLADSQKLQAILDRAQTESTLQSMVLAAIAGLIGLLVIWLTASGVTRPIIVSRICSRTSPVATATSPSDCVTHATTNWGSW